jgi:hypothetical protein
MVDGRQFQPSFVSPDRSRMRSHQRILDAILDMRLSNHVDLTCVDIRRVWHLASVHLYDILIGQPIERVTGTVASHEMSIVGACSTLTAIPTRFPSHQALVVVGYSYPIVYRADPPLETCKKFLEYTTLYDEVQYYFFNSFGH